VDVEAKTAEAFPHPAENMEWLNDDSLAYASTVPNSALRGTWFMRVGTEPVRLTEEPYLFSRDGKGCSAVLKKRGLFVFGTATGLFTVETNGSGFKEVKLWRNAAAVMQGLEVWLSDR
jgi:hypothetical protein